MPLVSGAKSSVRRCGSACQRVIYSTVVLVIFFLDWFAGLCRDVCVAMVQGAPLHAVAWLVILGMVRCQLRKPPPIISLTARKLVRVFLSHQSG